MQINFDELVDRRNTNSVKYDFAVEHGKPAGVLPLWVADMDFCAPLPVREALERAVQHGIFGYAESGTAYFNALQSWCASHYGWQIQPDWLVKTPGIVFAIANAICAFTREGDAVIIQQPVYHPFANCVRRNGRTLVNSPLALKDGAYHVDFQDFEEKIIANKVKLFVLCSPHNPIGKVWTREELTKLGDICVRHGVLVVSDEIHADFVYSGNHLVFASIKPEFLACTVTCTAPSKTFNLAGLQASNILIADETLREKFVTEMDKMGMGDLNTLAIVACQAAYEHGGDWLEQLKAYLLGNLAYVRDFLAQHLPQIKLIEPQGTYLLWLDFRALGLTPAQLDDLLVNKAGLWLNNGEMFGSGGEGFARLNMACPKATLECAMRQLAQAVQGL